MWPSLPAHVALRAGAADAELQGEVGGAASLTPGLESTRFQSLIVKKDDSAFNLNPGFLLSLCHYT